MILVLMALAAVVIIAMGITAQRGPGGDQWRFAVLCDTRGDNNETMNKTGINDTNTRALAEDIVVQGCDLVLVPGDMVNGWYRNGTTPYAAQFANWRRAMEPLYRAGVQVYPVRGDHENGVETELPPWPPMYPRPYPPVTDPALVEAFLEAFDDSYIPDNGPEGEEGLSYSFTHRNALFVGLDDYVNPLRVNQTWLDAQLEINDRNETPHVFVFGHTPAFMLAHPDCLAYYPGERDLFWDAISRAGGRIYFCGHDQLYDRSHAAASDGTNITQIVVGSCGEPLYNATASYPEGERVVGDSSNCNTTGYVLVTVDGSRVRAEWRAMEDGEWKARDKLEYDLEEGGA